MFIKLSPFFVFCDLYSERLVINSLLKRNPDLFLQVVTPRGGIKRFCRRPACMLPLAVSKIARKITQSLRWFGQSQPQSDVRVHGAVLRWGSGILLQNICAQAQVMVWLSGIALRVWSRLCLEVTKLYVNNKTVSPLLHYFQGAILWPSSVSCLFLELVLFCVLGICLFTPQLFLFSFLREAICSFMPTDTLWVPALCATPLHIFCIVGLMRAAHLSFSPLRHSAHVISVGHYGAAAIRPLIVNVTAELGSLFSACL